MHSHERLLRSLPSPNTLALRGHFNASVACITKQYGYSSEGMEET